MLLDCMMCCSQVEWVWRDQSAVFACRALVAVVADQSGGRELLDLLAAALLTTSQPRSSRPLLIAAACHEHGSLLVSCLARARHSLSPELASHMEQTLRKYRSALAANQQGCSVLKLIQSKV